MKTSLPILLTGLFAAGAVLSNLCGLHSTATVLAGTAAVGALSALRMLKNDAVEVEHRRRDRLDMLAEQERAYRSAILVSERLSHQFHELDEELTQIRSIIGSATSNLSESLAGLETASSGQQDLLTEMIEELIQVAEGKEHQAQTEGIRDFLAQTGEMICNLVGSLAASHPTVAEQPEGAIEEIAMQLNTLNDKVVSKWQGITDVSSRIRNHVHTGIVSLQFEDMAGQLIEHVRRRQTAVQEAFLALGSTLDKRDNPRAFSAALQKVEAEIEEKFHPLSRKAVSQTSVDTGSIDLF